jgi:hypothetical protein
MNKTRGLFGLVGAVTAATSAVSGLRAAREDNDKLALLNALASILVAITGAALAVRSLRKDGKA